MNESDDQETTQVWNELKPELDEALMALPTKHRDIVVLRYLEGKSNDEAATTLGMTPSARRVERLHRWSLAVANRRHAQNASPLPSRPHDLILSP